MSLVDIKTPTESSEGTTMKVQSWMKQLGDAVTKDEPLVEMETDKVTVEVEAPIDGILTEILVDSGTDVTPGMVIGRIETAITEKVAALSGDAPTTEKLRTSEFDDRAFTNKRLSPLVKQRPKCRAHKGDWKRWPRHI